LAPTGAWMAYTVQPNDGDATITVKELDGDKVHTIPAGSAPQTGRGGGGGGGGGGPPPVPSSRRTADWWATT
jgi:hypothetical protein